MATDVNDLDKRLSVLETEFENMENTIEKMDKVIHENFEGTLAIKERLDKWNGSIPHLVEDVKEVHAMQNKLLVSLNKNNLSDAKNSAKIKILWAVLVALASSGLTLAIKLLVP